MHRPDRGIHILGPTVALLPDVDTWAAGRPVALTNAVGNVLTYETVTARNYLTSDNWGRKPLLRKIVARAIRSVKEADPPQ